MKNSSCRSLHPLWLLVLAAALGPLASSAQPPTEHSGSLPNFDRRTPVARPAPAPTAPAATAEASAAISPRPTGEAALRARVRGLRLERDLLLGTVASLGSPHAFLTGPTGEETPAATEALTALPITEPHRRVKAFIDEHRTIFGHTSGVLTTARVARDYVTAHNGLRTTVWEQHVDEIRVFEATFQAHVTARGEIVQLASRLLPDAAAAKGALRAADAPLPARTAVVLAGRNLGEALADADVSPVGAPDGPEARQRFTAPRLTDTEVRRVWLPLAADALRLCWEVLCIARTSGSMYRVLVDATSGEVQVRHCLTEDVGPATYRVFTGDSPSPFSPGHSAPSSVQPPLVERSLVTLSALSTTASPNGWIDDGVMETRGNNVDAHTDTNADNVADLPRPQAVGAARVFDPPLDLTQPPSTYRDAAVVDLFYWCNWMHDRLYELGFTEAAGNFQNDNFGRGGLGNDALQADAQDGAGTNNANFSSPPDGSAPRMQMFTWTGPTPDRDGAFEHEVVLHEYAHGLSNRLVGGGVGISALVSRGMGEGWSDFYGIALLSEATDNFDAPIARGAYSRYLANGTFTENYYFGGRRYPYSTQLAQNPLTFKDIDPAQASPHTGVPRNPTVGTTADEVHNSGEVWAVTLWDARVNLIKKHGFAIGNQLVLQLVTDGMKLSPANPSFIQGRDAILQADRVATGGANKAELWAAFAKRGMGFNAVAPVSSTTVGLIENFDLPDDLEILPIAPLEISGQFGGPFAPASAVFTLTNNGTAPLAWTAAESAPWLELSTAGGALAAGASTTVSATLNASTSALIDSFYSANIVFTNTTKGVAQSRTVRLAIEPVHVALFSENFENATLDAARWTVTGTSTLRTQVTTAYAPHGGTRHLTMDSTANGTYARNEATLTLDLSGQTGVRLSFWAKGFLEEANGPPASPFVGGADFDGVAISADGTNWYEVQPLRSTGSPALTDAWTQFVVYLDPVLAARGLALNSTFKIRFNQYDNFAIATDGIAIDDIKVDRIVGAAAPTISIPPATQTASVGGTVTFSVTAASIPAPTYQWRFNGLAVPGATNPALTLTNLQPAHAGSYTVTMTNPLGAITSPPAILSGAEPAPVLTTQPSAVMVTAGQFASLTAAATGPGALTYQWRRNGFPLPGATMASYGLGSATRADAGHYDVIPYAGLTPGAVSQTVRLSVAPTAYPGLVAPDPAWDLRPEASSGTGYAFASLGDGSFYLGGSFSSLRGTTRVGVARIGASGSLDPAFLPPELDNTVRALAVQADGKLIVGGDFVRVAGVARNRLIRLNSDGTVDATFAVGSAAGGTVLALAVQADGKILVGGSFAGFAGTNRNFLVRLNADGSVDAGFLTLGMNSTVNALALQADGKLVVGGSFTTYANSTGTTTTRTRLARLNDDGTLDSSFSPTANNTVNALALQADTKLVVGGAFTSVTGTGATSGTTVGDIVRLNSDGSVDAAFATVSGVGFNSSANSLAVQSDGKIVVGGAFTTYSGATVNCLTRLNSDGTRDTGFRTGGVSASVNGVAVQASGKVLIAGTFLGYFSATGSSSTRSQFARLNADGTLDFDFSPQLLSWGSSAGYVPLPDGKTLVTGFFQRLRGVPVPLGVARLNADGTVDATFNAGGSGANSNVYAAALQADGKIVICGAFTTYNGTTVNRLARLNVDGTLDPTFDPGSGPNSTCYTLTLLPAGRIFVGGAFTAAAGLTRNRAAVFNVDGSIDTSFGTSVGFGSTVYTSALQTDGKLVVGGAFTAYNDTTANRVARLTASGTLDTTFVTTTGASSTVTAVAVQPDGKVIIGGFFSTYHSTTRSGLARLNAADGSLDPTFTPPSLLSVYSLLVQEDGRVLVRGSFPSVGGAPATPYLLRLAADGTRDASFGAGGFGLSSGLPSVLAMRDHGQLVMQSTGLAGLAATRPAAVPAITTEPISQGVLLGTTATLSVGAGSVLPLTYQWSFNAAPIPTGTAATLTVSNFQAANAGSYTVLVTNELGSKTSAVAVVTVGTATAPTIVTPPVAQAVHAGGTITLSVIATGIPAPNYQWRRNPVPLTNETGATFTRTNAQLADAGSYTVFVSNSTGNVTSTPVTVSVIPDGTSAQHRVVHRGYTPGGNVTIRSTLTYPGAATTANWNVLLPAGWSFASSTGDTGAVKPALGATNLLDWSWATPPASPIAFTYTLNVPAGVTGTHPLTASVTWVQSGTTIPLLGQPDPVMVSAAATRHAADSDGDGRLSLVELTRVIELYNVRHGTVRTGSYKVDATTEDGFTIDPTRPGTAVLVPFHSADTNADARLGLIELTRVIELFNVRSGTTRTGAYRLQAGTEDGFAPGPAAAVPAGFVLIPTGTFTMGSVVASNTADPSDGLTDAVPTHVVTLPAFYLAATPTTRAEWVAVRDWAVAHGYPDLALVGTGKADSHPVQTVAWFDVVKWCNAKSEMEGLGPAYYIDDAQTTIYRTGTVNVTNAQVKWTANGYRLPTEAEWEYAARGGQAAKRFPWGDTVTHVQANYQSSDFFGYDVSPTRGWHPTYATGNQPYTSPVGSFPANGFGLLDLEGNSRQWCWDWYAAYGGAAVTDPRGPAAGSARVARGSRWVSSAYELRAAYRFAQAPGIRGDLEEESGFRLARSSAP